MKLANPMTQMELIELYRTADLFAVASRLTDDGAREGIPNEIVEAVAIGVPVVATNIFGIP